MENEFKLAKVGKELIFFSQYEFKLARVGNNVPRGTLIMVGRCQLKLSLFTVKKKIIHKVWLYQILLLDLYIVNYKKNNDGNYTKKEVEKNKWN